jgi:hypothetical protein
MMMMKYDNSNSGGWPENSFNLAAPFDLPKFLNRFQKILHPNNSETFVANSGCPPDDFFAIPAHFYDLESLFFFAYFAIPKLQPFPVAWPSIHLLFGPRFAAAFL